VFDPKRRPSWKDWLADFQAIIERGSESDKSEYLKNTLVLMHRNVPFNSESCGEANHSVRYHRLTQGHDSINTSVLGDNHTEADEGPPLARRAEAAARRAAVTPGATVIEPEAATVSTTVG
jgi:hypothetical protein